MANQLVGRSAGAVLARLHEAARQDRFRFPKLVPGIMVGLAKGRTLSESLTPELTRELYIPVSREQGEFLYLTARALDVHNVVEFGTSFGVSSIYLAAALRDNGSGVVIGSEVEPFKCAEASRNLAEARLADFADVREGDALETLREVPQPVDLVLLDGSMDLYLPVLELLEPRLKTGAVVTADNLHTFRKGLRPYVEHMQSGARGFVSTTLPMGHAFEYSVHVGSSGGRPRGARQTCGRRRVRQRTLGCHERGSSPPGMVTMTAPLPCPSSAYA